MTATNRTAAPDLIFTRRDWLIALLIIALAFSYRLVIILDRATAPDNVAAFDPLPAGADQQTYIDNLRGFANGSYPPAKFYFQPGLPYFLRFASAVMGTTNLGALRVFTAAFAAINCGLMIAVGRLATGQRAVGVGAGLILALYPVSAFYDTDFVITSQAVILATLALFSTLWLWRRPQQWAGAVLLGLSAGAAVVTRLEVAALAVVCGLWLLAVCRNRRAIVQVGLALMLSLTVVMPVILHNRAGGADYLITPVGPEELYRGNSRDAAGTRGPSIAAETTHYDYFKFLVNDIALDPGRFAELLLRKVALFWSNIEPGNNLNYELQGRRVSPALAWNFLNFSILFAASSYGFIVLIRERQQAIAALLVLASLGFMAAVMLIWVEARVRTPVIVLLIPAAAYGIAHLFALMRSQPPRRTIQHVLPIALSIGVLLILINVAVHQLPHKVTVNELPASAVATHVVYDNVLELVGFEIQAEYSPPHILTPFKPYVVTLYWRLLEPTATDYSFALKYLIDSAQEMGIDRPIGMVVYPQVTTSELQPDRIYVEHVGLSYRRFDGPLEISGFLELTVYPERDFLSSLPAIDTTGYQQNTLVLARPAVRAGNGKTRFADVDKQIEFGDVLLLNDWQLPQAAAPGEDIEIITGWQSTQNHMDKSYAIGVFLFQDGEYILNVDSPPHAGRLLTLSIPPDYKFDDAKTVNLPDMPGEYEVRVGVYDQETLERLPVMDGIDSLYLLGRIRIIDVD